MVLKIGIISDREKRALRYPRSFLAKRVKRLECIYWTEIELSFAGKQRDENENGTDVYSLPTIKTQEIALTCHRRPFNSRVVKYFGFESGIIPNVTGIESHHDS